MYWIIAGKLGWKAIFFSFVWPFFFYSEKKIPLFLVLSDFKLRFQHLSICVTLHDGNKLESFIFVVIIVHTFFSCFCICYNACISSIRLNIYGLLVCAIFLFHHTKWQSKIYRKWQNIVCVNQSCYVEYIDFIGNLHSNGICGCWRSFLHTNHTWHITFSKHINILDDWIKMYECNLCETFSFSKA